MKIVTEIVFICVGVIGWGSGLWFFFGSSLKRAWQKLESR